MSFQTLIAYWPLKLAVIVIFLGSAMLVHFRGKVRHRFSRQLTDHSTFLAPYNALVYLFSRVPSKPFLREEDLPGIAALTAKWEIIRDEGMRLMDDGMVRASEGYNDLGFNSFFRRGWKRFYLKWYDDLPLPSAEKLCPETVKAAGAGAGFAWSDVRDAAAGRPARVPPRSLRRQAPLSSRAALRRTSNECLIQVDGSRLSLAGRRGLMFDETFIHFAENKTDINRIILFCDVERPMKFGFMTAINRWVSHHIVKASATQNIEGENVGVLNKVFGKLYEIHLGSRKVKEWNRNVYYTLKYAIVLGVLVLIFY